MDVFIGRTRWAAELRCVACCSTRHITTTLFGTGLVLCVVPAGPPGLARMLLLALCPEAWGLPDGDCGLCCVIAQVLEKLTGVGATVRCELSSLTWVEGVGDGGWRKAHEAAQTVSSGWVA